MLLALSAVVVTCQKLIVATVHASEGHAIQYTKQHSAQLDRLLASSELTCG